MQDRQPGRTRIKLAKIIRESLGWDCEPDELRAAGGRCRNNTAMHDSYAWEVFTKSSTGLAIVAGSFDTMTDCVKAGRVSYADGEISADWRKA